MVTSRIISEEKKEKKKETTYPCLMNLIEAVNNGLNYVIMFDSLRTGVVVLTEYKEGSPESVNTYKVGTYINFWSNCDNEEIWVPFKGTIQLKNS